MGAALELVDDLPAAVVIWEGSGSAIPPVQAQAVVCVASATQPPEYITGYLGTYRMLISDALFLTMCEPPFCDAARLDALALRVTEVNPDIDLIPTVFRPRPVAPVAGRRVALFSTAMAASANLLAGHLRDAHGADVTLVSTDLADRAALRDAVAAAADRADVYLTEIKAAAVDVVAEAAAGWVRSSSSATTSPWRSTAATSRPSSTGSPTPRSAFRRRTGAMTDDVEMVVVSRDPALPYSKGLMAQALMATGLSPERSYRSPRGSANGSTTAGRARSPCAGSRRSRARCLARPTATPPSPVFASGRA